MEIDNRYEIAGPPDVEWRYEMRRECQEIIPGLLLGPFQVSKQLEKLNLLGVTHIVCIRGPKEAWSVYPRFTDKFQYLTLDVEDTEEQNLIRLFPGALAFTKNAIAGGGKVLMHCNGGISLSPAFAIMFVMQHFGFSWDEALQYVQNRRYCISPNGGFLLQLKEYESIYRASQAVSSFNAVHPVGGAARRKREAEDTGDEMEDGRYPDARKKSGPSSTIPPYEVDTEMA